MKRTAHTAQAKREPRGRLLFERAAVIECARKAGLRSEALESELPPLIGVRRLASLLDVSPSWIRALYLRGVLKGQLFRPPLDGEAA